jgi:hypothetical protein
MMNLRAVDIYSNFSSHNALKSFLSTSSQSKQNKLPHSYKKGLFSEEIVPSQQKRNAYTWREYRIIFQPTSNAHMEQIECEVAAQNHVCENKQRIGRESTLAESQDEPNGLPFFLLFRRAYDTQIK